MLQHAVLVDAGFMGEGVRADDGLVRLHRETGDGGDQARGAGDHLGIDAGRERQGVMAGAQAHDDLLKRSVARALAEPVDRAFDLPRP